MVTELSAPVVRISLSKTALRSVLRFSKGEIGETMYQVLSLGSGGEVRAKVRGRVRGTRALEISLGRKGRLYAYLHDGIVHLSVVGDKNSQDTDIQMLR